LDAADPEAVQAFERKLDPGLVSRGFEVRNRARAGREVRVIARKDAALASTMDSSPVLVETVSLEGARLFSNDAEITDELLATKGGDGLLGERRGLAFELRVKRVVDQLLRLDLSRFPLIARAMAAKALRALSRIDRLDLSISPVEDGIDAEGRLVLAE
jgi:hypothetical protein